MSLSAKKGGARRSRAKRKMKYYARMNYTRADHMRQHSNKYLYPKDIRFRVHISSTRGDLCGQHIHKSFCSKDIRFRVVPNARPTFVSPFDFPC